MALLVMLAAFAAAVEPQQAPALDRVSILRDRAHTDELAYARLAHLCDRIGSRPAGSPTYREAVRWAVETLRTDRHQRVWQEPVSVPTWDRGRERCAALAPFPRQLAVLGLPGSVPGSVEAPVVVVQAIEEIGPLAAGRIVVFVPDIPATATAGERYWYFGLPRRDGAAAAARHGAVALLVASTPVHSLGTPHTGAMYYEDGVPRIPAAALASEDAAWLARLAAQGVEVRLQLELESVDRGRVEAANVLAEVPGSEHPEQVVLVGAHLDSWDVGQGAHDDGAGVIHVIETLRLIRELGVAPKRTVRAVLFANEEFGLDGGKAYAAAHGSELHVAAVESDLGAFRVLHFGASGSALQLGWLAQAAAPTGVPIRAGGGGADISALGDGVLQIGVFTDLEPYFDVHHSRADTLDKVDPTLLRDGLAKIAVLVWRLANEPLPAGL
ncbi:MAG: M20/M25/M40 family metallo-hydrolase [Thermoanaerobaculaceae bacterium]|nr:M20/M25/M40 family metallo-hydrolase [Thermoanaerobaculaceae bacterium]MDI9622112.1 M20/M25/M40 family metallo-hydrolase [Acidobacteriota bacterium]NLH11602.1 M20/M25/M40 family metallo-hydrolase [Holophagae bacterium]HPW56645.1 M20/M25/M40 family metallo-hydrolase [Thermoanaerobaculaceae bacterium]